ncbi:hypothetical protein ACJX0J_039099, partial [Zea mays]
QAASGCRRVGSNPPHNSCSSSAFSTVGVLERILVIGAVGLWRIWTDGNSGRLYWSALPRTRASATLYSSTSAAMAPPSWRQRHHTLLQALLSRGPLAEPDFRALFTAVSDRDPATHQQLFNDTLLKINKDLAYLQFELRACINQYDGMVYYGVVNNIADEESKLGTKYSVPQIAFYKGLLEAIVQEAGNDGSITSIDALNVRLDNQVAVLDGSQDSQSRLPSSIKNFSMSQKEKTLDELIRDRWLSYTATGKIGLGTRSFLDLRSWFRGNDIPSCVVCNEACIKASSCPNEGCDVRIHEYCLKKKFSQRKPGRGSKRRKK